MVLTVFTLLFWDTYIIDFFAVPKLKYWKKIVNNPERLLLSDCPQYITAILLPQIKQTE